MFCHLVRFDDSVEHAGDEAVEIISTNFATHDMKLSFSSNNKNPMIVDPDQFTIHYDTPPRS